MAEKFLQAAIKEARKRLAEGGIPIGSVLVIDGQIVGRGHNRRVLYPTLSPCDMCSGAALLYRIPRIVIGENKTFQGPEAYVKSRGVVIEITNDPDCVRLMEEFIQSRPEIWNEDIGE